MSEQGPSLMVTVVGSDRKQSRILAEVEEKLRSRGLRACILRNWRDTAIGDCDILLIGCGEAEVDLLAQQMEQLWMQRWSRWYSGTPAGRNPAGMPRPSRLDLGHPDRLDG